MSTWEQTKAKFRAWCEAQQMNPDDRELLYAFSAGMDAGCAEAADALNHAALLLALASDKVRCVDFKGDRFDLLVEAERFDALIATALGEGA